MLKPLWIDGPRGPISITAEIKSSCLQIMEMKSNPVACGWPRSNCVTRNWLAVSANVLKNLKLRMMLKHDGLTWAFFCNVLKNLKLGCSSNMNPLSIVDSWDHKSTHLRISEMKYKFAHGWPRSNLVTCNGLAVSANGPKNLKLGILRMLKY